MKNSTMTNEQKKELIINNECDAYYILIDQEAQKTFMAITWGTIQTIRDINGKCKNNDNACARKNAMLTMLELGLI